MVYCSPAHDLGVRMAMPQTAAASFLADVHVFDRRDYAAAVGREPDDTAIDAMLARHVRAREIKHVAEDVYGTLPQGCKYPDRYPVPPYLVAGRLRPGSVLAYHSALRIQGFAYSATCCITTAFAPAGAGEIAGGGHFYDFFDAPPGLVLERGADGVDSIVFMGVEVLATTVERTLADLFAHPVLGGDELIESIETIDFLHDLDAAALVRHIRVLGDPASAGAAGFWLESRLGRRPADDDAVRELRALAPRTPLCALGAKPVGGLSAEGWNVVLPKRFVKPEINGDRLSGT